MARKLDTRPPQTCLGLFEARAPRSGERALPPCLGETLRVLAASRPGGVFLCLGHGADEAGTWIHDGMDLASRLVVVVEDEEDAEILREIFADDLRVTVHVQDAETFLADVRDHRFDLLTELSPTASAALARCGLCRLAPGGLYVTRQSAAALAEAIAMSPALDEASGRAPDREAFALARLPGELGVTLVAHRTPRPEMKRRGGRRAREGITPLDASRSRRGRD